MTIVGELTANTLNQTIFVNKILKQLSAYNMFITILKYIEYTVAKFVKRCSKSILSFNLVNIAN